MFGFMTFGRNGGRSRFVGWILPAFLILFTLLPPGPAGPTAEAGEGTVDATVAAAFEELETYISGLPPTVLKKGIATSLAMKIRNAGAAYLRGQSCTSVNILDAYLKETQALLGGPHGSVAEDLYYRGLLLLSDVLAGVPDDRPCPHHPPDAECAGDAPWAELLPTTLAYAPRSIAENDGTFVEVTVSNRGGLTATDVVVAFRSDGQEFARVVIASISPCGTATTSVWWPGGSMGAHPVEAEVDPDGAISEGVETNNTAAIQVLVVFELVRPWEPSDLVLSAFTLNPARPVGGEDVSLTVTARNDGTEPYSDIEVHFTVDGSEVGQATLAELAAGEQTEISVLWAGAEPGRHYLAARAELPMGTLDRNTSNNTATALVHVGGETDPLPDLVVEEITVTEGGSYHVAATIRNIGWAEAVGLPVVFTMDGDALADATVPEIAPDESMVVDAVLSEDAEPGDHVFTVVIDPDDVVDKTPAPYRVSKVYYAIGTPLCPPPNSYGTWSSIGPDRLDNGWTGRADNIVIDPGNTNTMYVGAPTGGVWKTTVGGNSWTPVTDSMPSQNLSAMAMDSTDPQIIYAGSDAGLYKTTNGGAIWSVFIDTSIGKHVRTLIIRYSGAGFDIYAGTNTGVWRYNGTDKTLATSSPADWQRIKTGDVASLVQHPADPTRFWVAIWSNNQSTLYRSQLGSIPTGDGSWDQRLSFQGPVRLAAAPSQPEMLYAGISEPGTYEVRRSPDWGGSWYGRFSQATKGMEWLTDEKGGFFENYYNGHLKVDPGNADIIYRGHIQLYRSDGGGSGWTRIVGIHDDQHGLGFEPGNPETIFVLGDGGVFKCTGRGASCSSLNHGLRTMQFYDVALAEGHSSVIIGGTQDNGTSGSIGPFVWEHLRGGDGRYCAVSPTNPDMIYSQNQYLNSTAQAVTGLPPTPPEPRWQAASFVPETDHPYFIINPEDPSIILAAGPEVYEHSWGQTDWKCSGFFCLPWWQPLGPSGTGVAGDVRRIAVDSDGDIYAGMSSGQIWMLTGTTWELIFTNVSGRPVTGLVPDPDGPKELWVSFEGIGGAAGPNRIWNLEYAESLGSWLTFNITGDLDNSLALGVGWLQSDMLALDPYRDAVYVATNKGVYKGTTTVVNGNVEWQWRPFNCGLPRTYVVDLEVSTSNVLYAATFGRGLYAMPLYFPD